MKILIKNFAGGSPISIESNVHPEIGPLVSIVQNAQSIRFQHSLTPAQAREMATAFVAMADSFDEVVA